jgi:hypothetical protein
MHSLRSRFSVLCATFFVLISTFFTWKRVTPQAAQKQQRFPVSYLIFCRFTQPLFTFSIFPCHFFAEFHGHSPLSVNLLQPASMQSLCCSLTILVALSISLSTSVAHPKYDGRNHKHKHAPRQGAFAGIQMISSPGDPNPTDLLPSDAIVPGSAITAAPIPAPITDSSSKATDSILTNATMRTFPIRVIQIPVATICPANHSIPLPSPYTTSPINTTSPLYSTSSAHPLLNSTSPSTNATDYIPISANASIVAPTVTLADPSARLILGDNGCQTLFTPMTTAICSTVLSIGGQLPIKVTDCGQWVTFSSSPVCGGLGGAAPTAPSGSAEAVAYFLAPWYEIASGAVPAQVQVQSCSSASGTSNCVTGSESWSVSTTTEQSAVVLTAHFHGGAVGVSPLPFFSLSPPLTPIPYANLHKPQTVLLSFLPHALQTRVIPTKTLTTVFHKNQPLNLTLLPNFLTISIPSSITTTTLSIDTTMTHLSAHRVPTIVRLRQDDLGTTRAPTTSSEENTITTTIRVPVTKTYRVEAVTHHTAVTVTVEETVTSVVVVGGASSAKALRPAEAAQAGVSGLG